jgi:peptide/nickel transport system permease protein
LAVPELQLPELGRPDAAPRRPRRGAAVVSALPPGLRRWARISGRRLVFLPLTLFLVVSLVFFLTRIVGGNPAILLAGPQPTLEAIENIERELGIDEPLGAQYADYLGGVVTLDFGESFYTKASVKGEIGTRLPITIELVACGALVAVVLGVTLGVVAALRRRRLADHAARGLSVLGLSMPDFWLGLVLVFLLFFKLGWFPAPIGRLPVSVEPPAHRSGFVQLDALIGGDWSAFVAGWRQLALPALTLGLIYFALIFKATRAAMIDALRSDFVLYAEACGLKPSLRVRYALRQAMTLVVTYAGIIVATLIGGAVLVERVFSWGGLGYFGVDAIVKNDYPAIQGFVIAIGAVAAGIYFIVDLLYAAIDPRVRL